MFTKKWYDLYEKYKNKDMSDGRTRRGFERSFTKLSEDVWKFTFKTTTTDESIKNGSEMCSEMWFNIDDEWIECSQDVKKAYERALAYLYYGADRMNLNRWLRIRCLLNVGVK